jgi:integrase
MNLTENFLKQIAPTDARQTFRDDLQTGFGLRVEPKSVGGRKSFFWNQKVNGEVYFRSLGEWPATAVKEARDSARELAGAAGKWKRGGCVPAENPFAKKEKQAAPASAPTFETLVERYIKDHLYNSNPKGKRKKIHNPAEAEKSLRYALKKYFKSWMQKPVDSFKPEDVAALRDSALPHAHMGNRLVQWSKALFNWCANDGDGKVSVWPLPVNPAARIALADEPARERWLSPSELVTLETALDDKATPRDLADFVRLALDTGARKENILSAKWNDFDMDLKQWKILKSKSGAYTVDLLERAIQIIERRRSERASTSEFVFPCPGGKRGYLRIDKAFKALFKRIGGTIVDVRVHDLRRTSGTYQARAGVPLQKIAGNLGHSDRNIESVLIYAKLAQVDIAEARQAGSDKMAADMDAARRRTASQKTVRAVPRRKSA